MFGLRRLMRHFSKKCGLDDIKTQKAARSLPGFCISLARDPDAIQRVSTAMLDHGECSKAVIFQLENPLRIIEGSGPLQIVLVIRLLCVQPETPVALVPLF